MYKIPLILVAILAAHTTALGINCKGSFLCSKTPMVSSMTASSLNDLIQQKVDDNRYFFRGEKIACFDYFCAFIQKTPNGQGLMGSQVKKLAPYIVANGCKICGNVPVMYPGGNDVNKGELTFNYVDRPCGGGVGNQVCPY